MKNYHTRKGLIFLIVAAFILSSFISSFATTTTYTYDDVNHKVTVTQGTQGSTTYDLSGIVTDSNSSPVAGVTVALTGQGSTTTDSNGFYAFSGLANGSYTFSCSKVGYTFSPFSKSITINGSDAIAQNFTASLAPIYSISGTVTSGGTGLSGVPMTLSGASAATTSTDQNGYYIFSTLTNGSYTVSPSKTGYAFTPASNTFSINCTNVTMPNFTATLAALYTISGRVISGGSGIAGVIMTLNGTSSATATTDSSGYYIFSSLTNGSYTVSPSKAGYTFSPASAAVTISGASVSGQDFTGSVMLPSTPSGLAVSVMSSSQINLSWTDNSTNETGFKIERKPGGGSYAQIATVGANVTAYTDGSLVGDTQYYYRVKAYNGGGDSGYSNEAYATTLCANVRLQGANPVEYSTLQAAYDAAIDGSIIQTLAGAITGNVVINKNIAVTLQGGYDCGYTTNSGNATYLKGRLQTISGGGTLTISNFDLTQ